MPAAKQPTPVLLKVHTQHIQTFWANSSYLNFTSHCTEPRLHFRDKLFHTAKVAQLRLQSYTFLEINPIAINGADVQTGIYRIALLVLPGSYPSPQILI